MFFDLASSFEVVASFLWIIYTSALYKTQISILYSLPLNKNVRMSQDAKLIERPTSPHLSIYRPQISSVLSIMHRITGVALFVGTSIIVIWLWSAAYAPALYTNLHSMIASVIGQLLLLGWTLAFYYHLSNGIRHLFWDMGKGFALPTMHKSGVAVVASTLLMTALTWISAYSAGGH